MEPSEYYAALRSLALAGELEAQRCFIQGYFGESRDDNEHITASQRDEYAVLARQFIDKAIERGDWGVVRWLGRVRLDIADGLLHTAYPIGQSHPQTVYKMHYLLGLGETSEGGATSESSTVVEAMRRNELLTPEELRSAEGWALATYERNFKGRKVSEAATATLCLEQ